MEYKDVFSIRPSAVSAATGQLTELADRVQQVMQTEALNLTVQPSARDEVSQRVAATLNEVHASFSTASDQGQQHLREVSGIVRTHADTVAAADEGPAA